MKGGSYMTIQELATKTAEAMLGAGLTASTVWYTHDVGFLPIVRAHEAMGKEVFDREIVTNYVSDIERRIDQGEIKSEHYRKLLRGAQRLTEMHDHGKLIWTYPKLASKFKLNGYFQTVLDEFLSAGAFSPKGKSDAMWVARKYFSWLIVEGQADLSCVGAVEVQHFMIYCGNHMKGTSVHNVKLYMKKLYHFLWTQGYSAENYEALFRFKVFRESKLSPAAMPNEVAAILDIIDRRTPKGKRDYAIILLGIVTGLRAGDIVKLRLTDIDWQAGEIRIIQAKTGNPLTLPLTTDVGEAIKDYIFNGRQATESDAVFLRLHVPYKAFASGTTIQDLYDDYCKKAKFPRNAFDGKGFHSLRRAFGKGLVTAGVPISSVAQLIGDKDINSVKKYVALDSHHLKECALDFSGIEFSPAIRGGVSK
jgi:integrase